jgi:DNA polymerase-3 subunit chi
MTEVAFHVNLADKLGYACRLLRKAYAGGAKVLVTGEPDQLHELDGLLWQFSNTDFVPHCAATAGASANPELHAMTLAASPIVLAQSTAGSQHWQVLVNLSEEIPENFERFERLIELVGQAPTELSAARRRWKHYSDRGYPLKKHETNPSAAKA